VVFEIYIDYYENKQKIAIFAKLLIKEFPSFIRLRRVLSLHGDIRLMPCVIAFGSYKANKITLNPKGLNDTIAQNR
jgi:hypothetical protein